MNNQDKLVSINLTTYNRAGVLPRCLDSILNQSYQTFEIIIVDDFSSDNTPDIAKKYQNNDTRIKYFRHSTNLGNAYARNTALKNCIGYYVAFMDDDDEWIDKDKIKKQIEIFERSSENLAIVCTGVILIDEDGRKKSKIVKKPENLSRHILGGNGIIYSPTVMTKKNILDQAGGFDIKMPRGVDSDFYRECIVRYGYDVYFMPEITTAVHEYGDRMTPNDKIEDKKKVIWANTYLIYKYFGTYISYPGQFSKRLKKILKTLLKLMSFKNSGQDGS